ncbi:MAG TPA: glycosyltransferase family 2 protein [Verrucomicrobiae bacterium]|nr:glycosyltransferase family 2 protein [Verrucomicrobiae bacterium]
MPNWNGESSLKACLDSLRAQSLQAHVIVVDNGSVDGSVALIETNYPEVELIKLPKNLGFAAGVNTGFQRAIKRDATYVAAFNNDAVADKDWLRELVTYLGKYPHAGIAACKLLTADGQALDSTGDYYTVWGLPYPRGRGESGIDAYDDEVDIFAASGGASLYRVSMLQKIGLFDEKFFAYYEDVDLSFRAQLAGWKVSYVPAARVHHAIGATSSRVRGFTTYQTLKNLPMLLVKNVPRRYLWRISWRYSVAQIFFFGRAVLRGHGWSAIKGKTLCVWLLPRTLRARHRIQKSRTVSDEYIWGMLVHDLPPNARALRRLRAFGWKLRGKRA